MVSEVDSKDKESPDLASMVLQQATSSMVLKETSMVLQQATTQATAHPVLPHGEAEAMVAKAEAEPEVCSAPLMVRAHSTSPFLRLRECLSWWRMHATKEVCSLIQEGVEPLFPALSLNILPRGAPTLEQQQAALTVVQEYVSVGAATEVDIAELKDSTKTKFLVPWFIIEKASQSGPKKFRLISDCRVLNSALNPPKFRLENWKDILPQVKKGDWGVKLDIKNAYFHLENSPRLKPYLRLLIGGKLFQMEGGGVLA